MRKYVVDTNIILDLANDSNEEASKKRTEECTGFWEKVMNESDAVLLLPEEVKMELEVTLTAKEFKEARRSRIHQAISACTVPDESLSRMKERIIRRMSAILAGKFRHRISGELGINPISMQVSDARILYAALEEDAVIVTRNIKDFILFVALNEPGEEVLYDISKGRYMTLSETLHREIHADSTVQGLLFMLFEEQ